MSAGFVGVVVSDPSLQGQFTQVELRSLKAKVTSESVDSPPPRALETALALRFGSSVFGPGWLFCFVLACVAVRVSEEGFRPCHHEESAGADEEAEGAQ
jgi:hypothetical protein